MISENENDILMMGRCNQGLADKLEAARAERDELKERISGLITFGEKRDAEALRLAELLDHSLKKGQELRAELQAPAGSDVETADADELTAEIERLVCEMKPADRWAFIRYKIASALRAARGDCEAVKDKMRCKVQEMDAALKRSHEDIAFRRKGLGHADYQAIRDWLVALVAPKED